MRATLSMCDIEEEPVVVFSALDTLLQFCEYDKVPAKDLDVVRRRRGPHSHSSAPHLRFYGEPPQGPKLTVQNDSMALRLGARATALGG